MTPLARILLGSLGAGSIVGGILLLTDERARKFCVTARSPREAARKLEGLGAKGRGRR